MNFRYSVIRAYESFTKNFSLLYILAIPAGCIGIIILAMIYFSIDYIFYFLLVVMMVYAFVKCILWSENGKPFLFAN